MKRIIIQLNQFLILPLLAAVLLFQVQVSAEEQLCTATIPVEIQTLGDSVPSGIEYKIVIKSENEINPMPEIKEVVMKDNGEAELGPMTYTTPGTYQYSVYQEIGSTENLTYDGTAYTVTICIVNDGNGGLKPEIFAVKEGAQGKIDKIIFSNTYNSTEPAETTKPAETPEATETEETTEPSTAVIETPEPATVSTYQTVQTNLANAPKTGERIISAIVVGILGISMFILSIVFYKKKNEEE